MSGAGTDYVAIEGQKVFPGAGAPEDSVLTGTGDGLGIINSKSLVGTLGEPTEIGPGRVPSAVRRCSGLIGPCRYGPDDDPTRSSHLAKALGHAAIAL